MRFNLSLPGSEADDPWQCASSTSGPTGGFLNANPRSIKKVLIWDAHLCASGCDTDPVCCWDNPFLWQEPGSTSSYLRPLNNWFNNCFSVGFNFLKVPIFLRKHSYPDVYAWIGLWFVWVTVLVEGRVHQDFLVLRDNEVFVESSHLLLSDTGGKELTTLMVAGQFLDYL